MMCLHLPLHWPIFCWMCAISRAFDFVRVPAAPLVSLNLLARLKEVPQNLVENFNVGELTGRVGTLDPHQVPCEDVDAQLVAEGGLPCVLVGFKGVPLLRDSLLRDSEVGAINRHCAVVANIVGTEPALEDYLYLRGAAVAGV